MMKMNGMKMLNYWLSLFLFNVLMTFFTFALFLFFGYTVLQLSLFTQTNFYLLLIILTGWGLA